jgi:hypothetical protein
MDSPIELNGYWVNSVSVEDVDFGIGMARLFMLYW